MEQSKIRESLKAHPMGFEKLIIVLNSNDPWQLIRELGIPEINAQNWNSFVDNEILCIDDQDLEGIQGALTGKTCTVRPCRCIEQV